jgi:MazG family protein
MSATADPHDDDPHADDPHAALARTEGASRARGETAALARLTELLGIVYRLRDEDGCPWDRKQTLDTMTKNLIEEAFEVTDAVAAHDNDQVAEELGDTLMNVILMARIAEQEGRFDLAAVAAGIATKLVRRHPHVFGDREADDAESALASWNDSKAAEGKGRGSALDGVPAGLPALLSALKVGQKAADVGFDWPDATGALEKLSEELEELLAAESATDVEEELGDVLFAAVNVARKHKLDPELVLRRTIVKFRRRFAAIEAELGERLSSASLEEMERVWRAAAEAERA